MKGYVIVDSLIDFVRWHYNHIQNASMFIFDNDSKTVIARNTPAWQIEYDTGFAGESTHNLDIVTISNGTYYTIEYLADSLSFNKFLSVVKQMISSLQFIPVRPITTAEIPPYFHDYSPKKPSFAQ